MGRRPWAFSSQVLRGIQLAGLGVPLQGVEDGFHIELFLQRQLTGGAFLWCPVRRGCIVTWGLRAMSQNPVGVKGDSGIGRAHVHFGGCGAGLPLRALSTSFGWPLLCGCFFAVSTLLVVPFGEDAVPVDKLRLTLQVVEARRSVFLCLPFLDIFFAELVPQIQPKARVHCHIRPPEPRAVGHPDVYIRYQGAGQTAHSARATAK